MARLTFTGHLRDIAPEAPAAFPGDTLGEVLQAAFGTAPRLRHYILDDQGRVRQHVIIFIDDEHIPRETALSVPITEHSDIYVLQALSGG